MRDMGSNNEGVPNIELCYEQQIEMIFEDPHVKTILCDTNKRLFALLDTYLNEEGLPQTQKNNIATEINESFSQELVSIIERYHSNMRPILTNDRTSKNFFRMISRYDTIRAGLTEPYVINLGDANGDRSYINFTTGNEFMKLFGKKLKQKRYLCEEFHTIVQYITYHLNRDLGNEKRVGIRCEKIEKDFVYLYIYVRDEGGRYDGTCKISIPLDHFKLFLDIFLAEDIGYSNALISTSIKNPEHNATNRLISDFNNDQEDDDEDEEESI